MIGSLAAGRRLGIIKPDAGQVEKERDRYAALGIDATVTAAVPLRSARPGWIWRARPPKQFRAANCDLVWMTCVGMDAPMRDVVAEVTGVPVILAHALLARIVTELLEGAREVGSQFSHQTSHQVRCWQVLHSTCRSAS